MNVSNIHVQYNVDYVEYVSCILQTLNSKDRKKKNLRNINHLVILIPMKKMVFVRDKMYMERFRMEMSGMYIGLNVTSKDCQLKVKFV